MAYIVKQRTKTGRTNIYVAESHHVPTKGARQTRRYLGVLSDDKSELLLNSASKEGLSEEIIALLKKKEIEFKGKNAGSVGRKCGNGERVAAQRRLTKTTLALAATLDKGCAKRSW